MLVLRRIFFVNLRIRKNIFEKHLFFLEKWCIISIVIRFDGRICQKSLERESAVGASRQEIFAFRFPSIRRGAEGVPLIGR